MTRFRPVALAGVFTAALAVGQAPPDKPLEKKDPQATVEPRSASGEG